MKNLLYEYPLDSLLTTDEWEHVRYLIGEWLKGCEVEGRLDPVDLPFIPYFEATIKEKLIKAGFDKEALDNPDELKWILKALDRQGIEYIETVFEPQLFPSGTFTVFNDNRSFLVEPDIDAALRALESIKIIKRLLANKGVPNREAVKVYLHTIELTINLSRAGVTPELARIGIKNVEGGKDGGEKSGEIRRETAARTKEKWQAESEKIWKKHSSWSKARVAMDIKKRIGGNVDTIRKFIQKPLP